MCMVVLPSTGALATPQKPSAANNFSARGNASWTSRPFILCCLIGLSLWSCAGHHSWCEFMSVLAKLHLEDSVLQYSFPNSGPYNLPASSSTMFPWGSREWVCDIWYLMPHYTSALHSQLFSVLWPFMSLHLTAIHCKNWIATISDDGWEKH